MEDCRYIFSIGDLFRQDNSITVRINDKNNYIPAQQLKELYCFNECTITTKLLDMFSKTGTIIHFFNYYGNYTGSFVPKEHYISGKLTINQALAFENKRLEIAKAIVVGISKNIHSVLYHYYRHGKNELKPYLDCIKNDLPKQIASAKTISHVLAIEGNMWNGFYSSFRYFLPEDFLFNKRVRRPPDNPMNALISFGNSILYTKTISEIYNTHLNQAISFLHEPSEGRFSLCLDLCEVFKPIIVFNVIFNLVNTKQIQVEKHFNKELNYCLLNEKGKRIFVESLDNKLNETIQHSALKRNVSYQTCIKIDGYKLIKFILEDKEFVPFYIGDKK